MCLSDKIVKVKVIKQSQLLLIADMTYYFVLTRELIGVSTKHLLHKLAIATNRRHERLPK